jgi:hypothetical protein
MTNNLIIKNDVTEYENRSYDDLSSGFQKLLHFAVRASELISLMYNRFTLIEKYSHKEAVTKIQDDHKHLAGFSSRNIRRSLPVDNPNVRRRVRPPWHKNSIIEANPPSKLSDTIQQEEENLKLPLTSNNADNKKIYRDVATKQPHKPTECSSCALSLENSELKEALEKTRQLTTADKIISAAVDCNHNKEEESKILPFEFTLSKKEILDSWGELYLEIADANMQVWFSGKIDTKNHRVISTGIGRSQQEVECNNTGDTQDE